MDDCCTDDSVDLIKAEFPKVRLTARSHSGGFSAAVNDGIMATESKAILVPNTDVDVTPGLIAPLVEQLDGPNVFAVAPRILLPNQGNMDEGAKTRVWHHGMFYPTQRSDSPGVVPVLYATACTALYRHPILEELGGSDCAYCPAYYENTDTRYRAWKRGWASLYELAATVYHQHSTTTSKLNRRYINRIKSRNSVLYIWRNIEDATIRGWHRRWLGIVLLRRTICGDTDLVRGWRMAFLCRAEAISALRQDSKHRKLSDREVFSRTGVLV